MTAAKRKGRVVVQVKRVREEREDGRPFKLGTAGIPRLPPRATSGSV